MKRIIISLVFITFVYACNQKKAIGITSSRKTSLDTIISGQSKTTTVTIKNIGTDILKIEDFICSCECTVPKVAKNTLINPKDSLNIKVSVKAYSDDIGKWKKVLCTFKTNSDSIFLRHNIIFYTKSNI